jgi:flagellar hook-associated protein 1 FlgK
VGIIDIVEIGKQGLAANREALQTTSNNIANANTPGYTRQRAVMHANETALAGGGVRLGGVQLKDVIRVHDGFIQNQLLDESKTFGSAKMRSENLHRLEDMVSGESARIGDKVTGLFNSFRELSANPETAVLRNNVASNARSTADAFRGLSNSLQGMRKNIDDQLEVQVQQINSLTKELAELNGTLANSKARGETPLELEDRREAILRELSTKVGFQIAADDQDHTNVVAGNGLGTLVNGNQASELYLVRTPERGDKGPGSVDLFIRQGSTEHRITGAVTDGEVGGLLHVRDEVIGRSLKRLDDAAYQLANAVNDIHREGVGVDGQSQRNLFYVSGGPVGAAEQLDVADAIKKSSENIAVGVVPGAAGDNRIALRLAELQNAKIFSDNPDALPADRPKTINESLDGLIGKIALQAKEESDNFEHHDAIMKQLDNYRQSVSGVNLEEEAVNMMQYQSVYNASAKAMKLGDELLQTVLNLR